MVGAPEILGKYSVLFSTFCLSRELDNNNLTALRAGVFDKNTGLAAL